MLVCYLQQFISGLRPFFKQYLLTEHEWLSHHFCIPKGIPQLLIHLTLLGLSPCLINQLRSSQNFWQIDQKNYGAHKQKSIWLYKNQKYPRLLHISFEYLQRKYATLKYIGVHKGTTLFAFLHGKIDLMHQSICIMRNGQIFNNQLSIVNLCRLHKHVDVS